MFLWNVYWPLKLGSWEFVTLQRVGDLPRNIPTVMIVHFWTTDLLSPQVQKLTSLLEINFSGDLLFWGGFSKRRRHTEVNYSSFHRYWSWGYHWSSLSFPLAFINCSHPQLHLCRLECLILWPNLHTSNVWMLDNHALLSAGLLHMCSTSCTVT